MTLNEKLADLVHEIEEGKRLLSWANIEELGVLARSLGRTRGAARRGARRLPHAKLNDWKLTA